jgi:hypothetical protein
MKSISIVQNSRAYLNSCKSSKQWKDKKEVFKHTPKTWAPQKNCSKDSYIHQKRKTYVQNLKIPILTKHRHHQPGLE